MNINVRVNAVGKNIGKNAGFEVCNAKCIDKQNQCLEFAERLKVAVEKD